MGSFYWMLTIFGLLPSHSMAYVINSSLSDLDKFNLSTSSGVFFNLRSQFGITTSSWLATLVLDLEPYNLALQQLSANYRNSSKFVQDHKPRWMQQTERNDYARLVDHYLHFDQGIEVRLNVLSSTLSDLDRLNKEISVRVNNPSSTLLFPRFKRSLLPLGGFLSSLFGVASQNDIDTVKSQITLLRKSAVQENHVLADQLSLLNITVLRVQENRHLVNRVIHFQEEFSQQLAYMSNSTCRYLEDLKYFSLFVFKYQQICVSLLTTNLLYLEYHQGH